MSAAIVTSIVNVYHTIFSFQVQTLLKIAKTNFVVMKLLMGGHKKEDKVSTNQVADIPFVLHKEVRNQIQAKPHPPCINMFWISGCQQFYIAPVAWLKVSGLEHNGHEPEVVGSNKIRVHSLSLDLNKHFDFIVKVDNVML